MNNLSPKVVINPVGGLANRMRALASGLSLAGELNCDYEIVWFRNWELNARIEDIFEVPPEITARTIYPSVLRYNLLYSVPRKQNLYISGLSSRSSFGLTLRDSEVPLRELALNDKYDEIKSLVKGTLNNGKNTLLQAGIPFYPYDAEFYRNLFMPVKEIRKRVDRIMSRLGKESIGIHIRRSDNKESIRYSPDSLFIEEMNATIKLNPEVQFYLATDDEPTKIKFRELYGSKIIFSDSKADRATTAGIVDAATEMFALSQTSRIIGSFYSSFSEAAATLGGKPFSQVHGQ